MTLESYKVITAEEMARVERLSIEEGASNESYMLKAGSGIAEHAARFVEENHREKEITLLVGKGNNGGDAYAAGTFLLKEGFRVRAYHLFSTEESSPLCRKHEKLFKEAGGEIFFPKQPSEITFPPKGIILDGLLGTGFQGKLEGLLLETVKYANGSRIPILAIDIPSGVNGSTGKVDPAAIEAAETLFLEFPKLGFFIGEGYNYVGRLAKVSFGLEKRYLDQARGAAYLLNEKVLPSLLPHLVRSRHKYQAGYILAVSGSPGMSGAALLSCLAALRTGAGIVRLFYPLGMEQELIRAPYEIIRTPYKMDDPSPVLLELPRAAACLIGPGLGKSEEIGKFLHSFIKEIDVPTVIDADGLFHLKGSFSSLKMGCVLTPHEREMLHLLGKKQFEEGEKLSACQKFAEENGVTVVLKGGPTFIFHPGAPILIVPRGDPGMATAGTGDVLTGMIAAFLAQKVPPREAAVLGVYIHARSGELVAEKHTSYDLIASDLLEELPQVFLELL